jgi:hypothetical protein
MTKYLELGYYTEIKVYTVKELEQQIEALKNQKVINRVRFELGIEQLNKKIRCIENKIQRQVDFISVSEKWKI